MSVAAFLRHAWPAHLPHSHFPAGERRDAKTGAKLKAMGLAAGWPDFILIMPNGQAAFLELKRSGGALSPEQTAFRDRVQALGCGYAVATTFEQAEAHLTRWLALYGLEPRARTVQRAPAPLLEAAG